VLKRALIFVIKPHRPTGPNDGSQEWPEMSTPLSEMPTPFADKPPPLVPRGRGGRTTVRGYDAAHKQLRERLSSWVASGTCRCSRCGELIQPGQKWHLDHADGPLAHRLHAYRGPSHAACNNGAKNKRKELPPAVRKLFLGE
jgi:hypothetical protein